MTGVNQMWQPIETGPRDGRLVLGFGGSKQRANVTRFNGYHWTTLPGRYVWAPTHWMPLPRPPTEATVAEPSEAIPGHIRTSRGGLVWLEDDKS